MYPLTALLAIGILRRDPGLWAYVAPLSLIGIVIAGYHNLLYYGLIAESAQPCRLGVSCTDRQIDWFGFIGIPLLALTAFVVINTCVALAYAAKRRQLA